TPSIAFATTSVCTNAISASSSCKAITLSAEALEETASVCIPVSSEMILAIAPPSGYYVPLVPPVNILITSGLSPSLSSPSPDASSVLPQATRNNENKNNKPPECKKCFFVIILPPHIICLVLNIFLVIIFNLPNNTLSVTPLPFTAGGRFPRAWLEPPRKKFTSCGVSRLMLFPQESPPSVPGNSFGV